MSSIINSAAMNIGVHMSLSVLVSSVCVPSRGIAGSYGRSISRINERRISMVLSFLVILNYFIKYYLSLA